MADEPTAGELSRQLAELRQDNREEHERLRRGIAHKVSNDRYFADQRLAEDRHNQLRQDVSDIKEARKDDAERIEQAKADRAANRKWLIASLIVPVGIGILEIYFAIKGVK